MNDKMLLTAAEATEAAELIERMKKLADRYQRLTKGKAAHLFLVAGHATQDPDDEGSVIERHAGATFGYLPLAVSQLSQMADDGCAPLNVLVAMPRPRKGPDLGFSAS